MSKAEGRLVFERYRKYVATAAASGNENASSSRRLCMQLAEGFPIPEDALFEPVDAGGVPGEWVRTKASRDDTVLLYFHGGGYVSGCMEAYRHFVADLATRTGSTGLSVDYALAPERPFPAAIEDTVKSYRFLLDRGIAARRILVAGDSCGGGLSMALMLSLRDAGLPQPAASWLISPLADLEISGESNVTQAHLDPVAIPPIPEQCAAAYLAGASPRHPLASPIHANLSGLAPIRIDVGSHETLLDDAIRLTRRAALDDLDVELRVWGGMVHVFPFFSPILAEGRESIDMACAFLRRHLRDGH
jgi:epsilon-lactone hydrolase